MPTDQLLRAGHVAQVILPGNPKKNCFSSHIYIYILFPSRPHSCKSAAVWGGRVSVWNSQAQRGRAKVMGGQARKGEGGEYQVSSSFLSLSSAERSGQLPLCSFVNLFRFFLFLWEIENATSSSSPPPPPPPPAGEINGSDRPWVVFLTFSLVF